MNPYVEVLKNEISALREECDVLRYKLAKSEEACETLCTTVTQKDAEIEALKSRCESLLRDRKCAVKLLAERKVELNKALIRADLAENEIIRFKAKLYDLMESND